jgi:hypothetical protein
MGLKDETLGLPAGGLRSLSEIGAIPDSAIAQYDFRKEDGTMPVTDQTGNGRDLDTGSYSGVGRSINSQQSADFDNDRIEGGIGTYSERLVIFTVINVDSTSDMSYFDDQDSSRFELFQFSNEVRIHQGGNTQKTGKNPNTGTNYLYTTIWDSTDVVRRNGTEILSTSGGGSSDLVGFVLGDGNGGSLDGTVGFVELHDGDPSNGLTTREQGIADDWGITI